MPSITERATNFGLDQVFQKRRQKVPSTYLEPIPLDHNLQLFYSEQTLAVTGTKSNEAFILANGQVVANRIQSVTSYGATETEWRIHNKERIYHVKVFENRANRSLRLGATTPDKPDEIMEIHYQNTNGNGHFVFNGHYENAQEVAWFEKTRSVFLSRRNGSDQDETLHLPGMLPLEWAEVFTSEETLRDPHMPYREWFSQIGVLPPKEPNNPTST